MPFISDNLLLDLPFNQTQKEDSTKWVASSPQNLTMTAEKCKLSNLDLLGSCLQIEDGGQLTLSNPIPSLVVDDMHQVTIEFWAEPDLVAIGGERKYILQGPVIIWMQGKQLHWFISKDSTLQSYVIEEVEGLHHWAIVVNNAAGSAQITFFKDGVEVTNKTTSISITDNLNNELKAIIAATTNPFVIGAKEKGWTGKLAHLRVWKTALSATQLTQNMQRDVTAHAAFKATTGLGWRLINADDEPSLYIHSNAPQELRLEMENVTKETTFVISQSDKTPSFQDHHFCLVFRPGTLKSTLFLQPVSPSKSEALIVENIGTKNNKEWNVALDKWNEQDCICFLSRKKLEINPNEKITILLPEIAAEPGAGSRPTEVGLKYKNLEIKDSEQTLDGHRAQRLNILYREPSISNLPDNPPLEVGIVGAPVVLNNGSETCLTLYIKNLKRNEDEAAAPLILGSGNNTLDKQPKFILKIDTLTDLTEESGSNLVVGDKYCVRRIDPETNTVYAEGDTFEIIKTEDALWTVKNLKTNITQENIVLPEKVLKFGSDSTDAKGLGDVDDLMNSVLAGESAKCSIEGPKASGNVVSWTISPTQSADGKTVSIPANETLILSLSGLKTTAPPGRSVLRLRYEDFDKYGEGVFEIPIDRGPVIPAKLTQAGGAGYGLAIGHDPRVKKPGLNTEVLDEILSIKKEEGNGDAVRIENFSVGTGLNIVQNGDGLAAKFSSPKGKGVEIDGKLSISMGESQFSTIKATQTGSKVVIPDAQSQTQKPLSVAPIAYFKLNEVRVNNLLTESIKGLDGTIYRSVRLVDDDKFGKCLQFDGSLESYVELPPKVIPTGRTITLCFWAWGDSSLPVNNFVIHAKTSQESSRVLGIHLPYGDRNIYFDCGYNSDYDRVNQEAEESIFKGRWTHWTFVKDANSGVMTIYIDGKEWHSGTGKTRSLPTANLVILGNAAEDSKDAGYRGKLAHLRIYDRVLEPTQVLQVMEEDQIQKSALTVTQHQEGLAAKFIGGDGVTITGDLRVGKRIRDKTGEIMPVGAVLPFAGTVAPEGWLLCNGQQVIGEQYQDLAKVLFGEKRNEFNVPDYREKFIVGATGKGDYTLDALGKLERGKAFVTLSENQMPKHKHDVKDKGHSHSVPSMRFGYNNKYARGNADMQEFSPETSNNSADIQETEKGAGEPHENRPPFVALNYIIKY